MLRHCAPPGLNVDAAYQNGCTALWLAAANGHRDCVRLLAEAGADIDKPASNGVTPVRDALPLAAMGLWGADW